MIIGFDFDGTLTQRNEFPKIGEPNQQMIDLCKRAQDLGIETILWTCRVEKELQSAVDFCKAHGLNFSAVNDNAPSNIEAYKNVYKEQPRKVYCDYYVDDKAIGWYPVCAAIELSKILDSYEMKLRNAKNIIDKH